MDLSYIDPQGEVGADSKNLNKPWPRLDGQNASRWYGRLRVQKLTLSMLNCAHAPEQSFHGWHFFYQLAPSPEVECEI